MNTDLSVAPEIALLAAPRAGTRQEARAACTDGRIAADLADLAATPQRWWDLVRFDPDRPLRICVPGLARAWLLVVPPGGSAGCSCWLATALAGEAAETAAAGGLPRPLRPGRVRVHGAGAPHRHHSAGPGYSVTLHSPGRPRR